MSTREQALRELIAKWRKMPPHTDTMPLSDAANSVLLQRTICARELEAALATSAPSEPLACNCDADRTGPSAEVHRAGCPQASALPMLTHSRSCPQLNSVSDDFCTCGLEWRMRLQTEIEMHNAWRKRAEEAERLLMLVPHDHSKSSYPGVATCVRCLIEGGAK